MFLGGLYKYVVAGMVIFVAGSLTACGDDPAVKPKADQSLKVAAPSPPDAATCAATALKTDYRPDDLAPDSGTYSYSVTGSRKVLGAGGFTKPLPARSQFIVTPAEDFGNIRCFTVQRRYAESLADTATFAIRGGDVYLTKLDAQSGGQFTTIEPVPPALSLDGDEPEWSGDFRGATSSRYRGEVIGRRRLKVGGRRVAAIGIKAEFSFAGELTGYERSVRWISTRDNLVLTERVLQQRDYGVDKIRLTYTARLKSMPERSD